MRNQVIGSASRIVVSSRPRNIADGRLRHTGILATDEGGAIDLLGSPRSDRGLPGNLRAGRSAIPRPVIPGRHWRK